jgi:uncharacterized protein YciI
MTHLFLINLTYKVGLNIIDEHRNDHISFLEKGYKDGIFLISGPKVPRDGGVILAQHTSKEELERYIQKDPFIKHDLANCDVHCFNPTMFANASLEKLLKTT